MITHTYVIPLSYIVHRKPPLQISHFKPCTDVCIDQLLLNTDISSSVTPNFEPFRYIVMDSYRQLNGLTVIARLFLMGSAIYG